MSPENLYYYCVITGMAADYHLVIINNQAKLEKLAEKLISISLIALGIKTVEWWNRQREQIALIQFAFHHERKIFVTVNVCVHF